MSNALSNETSPYLLQHADNPVDWHPWDQAALEHARSTGKPILLSIGYSACHWCHVMAHESFEDSETAAVMNELFVNIKVDREERPDLDRIYQTAQQMFTGRAGGWPLTMFLTPNEHMPIFAGTYFPKRANYGMPAFRDVLTRVESYFRSQPDEIRRHGKSLVDALRNLNRDDPDSAASFSTEPIVRARQRLAETFDSRYGGFGDAPKFPHPSNLDLLLEIWRGSVTVGTEDVGAKRVATFSLTKMALGGLYDHLGGGFYRYSVDRQWAIPHFEKMLYDNAALLGTYSDAYAATGDALYANVANATADWVIRDMQDNQGGFYATLDADSEGHEGKFYVWTPDQFDALLDADEAALSKRCYGLTVPPNFEGEEWHLQIADAAFADECDTDLLASARAKLLAARQQRVWPGRDDKVLVAWNGMMIGALAKAARNLGRPDLAAAATHAVEFIRAQLWQDGRLKATYKDGRARFAGYLDDYAFLAAGLIELLQCRWRSQDLHFAQGLADALLAHFADPRGGFFFTADDHEQLIHRPKPLADEAIPAGNAVAALTLLDLGHLLGESRYLDAAEAALRAALASIDRYPEAHATFLRALGRQLAPPELVILRGDIGALAQWQARAQAGYHPQRLTFAIPDDAEGLPGLLATRNAAAGPVAYLCSGTECRAPIDVFDELAATLDALQKADDENLYYESS
jgi:uncharacterized protein YyaL (SSP411 family)